MIARRERASALITYRLCSLLLEYPGDELLAARADLLGAVAALPLSPAAAALRRFCEWWGREEALTLRRHYVEAIDLDAGCELHLTCHGDGDAHERAAALLRLKRLYRAAGLPMEGAAELPDYLPAMLEFAAAAAPGRGDVVLAEHRAALEALRGNLRKLGSPYAGLLDAVCLTLGSARGVAA